MSSGYKPSFIFISYYLNNKNIFKIYNIEERILLKVLSRQVYSNSLSGDGILLEYPHLISIRRLNLLHQVSLWNYYSFSIILFNKIDLLSGSKTADDFIGIPTTHSYLVINVSRINIFCKITIHSRVVYN